MGLLDLFLLRLFRRQRRFDDRLRQFVRLLFFGGLHLLRRGGADASRPVRRRRLHTAREADFRPRQRVTTETSATTIRERRRTHR
jgi:hypothetical protein